MRARLSGFFVPLMMMVAIAFAAHAGAASPAPAQSNADAAKYVGTWTGTWDGAGTGGFELTLEKNADGAPAGKVSVTGEPTYKATLKKVSFDGAKMSGLYDFPPDDRVEIVLAATFEGNTAKGTWTARSKDNGSDVATGGWTVKKQ